MIAGIVTGFANFILGRGEPNPEDANNFQLVLKAFDTPFDGMLLFASVCLIAPFFEELFFRGYLLSTLTEKFSPIYSAILCGIIFATIHFEPSKLLELSILGIVLSYAKLRSGSLLVCMIIHFLVNFQTMALMAIAKL